MYFSLNLIIGICNKVVVIVSYTSVLFEYLHPGRPLPISQNLVSSVK